MRAAWLLVAVGCGSPSSPEEPPSDSTTTAEPELVVELDDPGVIAVDATHVYVTHGPGNISRIAKTGGALDAIATAQPGPTSLDVSTGRACWVNSGTHSLDFRDGSVRCADRELAAAWSPNALAIDGGVVFWTEVDGQQVRGIALDGSALRTLDDEPTSKIAIAVSATHVAWTASGDMADVVVMDRATRAKTTISTSEYAPGGIVLDGNDVYWVARHALSEDGAVRVARSFGAPVDLAPGEHWPSQLVHAGDRLYWLGHDRIRSVAAAGGAPATVVDGRGAIGGIAVDATHVYWTERDRGAVVRMPR